MFMHKRDGAHSATRLGPLWTLKSHFFLPCSLYSFTSTTERVSLLKTLLRLLLGLKNKVRNICDCVEDWQTDRWTERQRRSTMCLLIWLFNGALVQHCASWFLNVDFATLCRAIVYYCCFCSLESLYFILFGAEFVKKK